MKDNKKDNKQGILFILHLPPPVHGAGIVGEQIRNSLPINNSFHGTYLNLSTSRDISEIGETGWIKFFRYFRLLVLAFVKAAAMKNRLCYISLNSHGKGFYKDFVVVLIVRLFFKRVVYHFHNQGVKKYQHRFFDNLLYRIAFKNTDIILLSQRLYSDISRYVSADRIYICPNGIAVPDIVDDGRSINDTPVILFLSNMMRSKGVLSLVTALGYLKKSGVGFFCIFAGNWGDILEKEFLQAVKKSEVETLTSFAGPVYGSEKDRLFRTADMFVLPSFDECFPLVLLEAMSYRLPVVSSFSGGIPDIVKEGETGLLCDPSDPEALASNIGRLLQDGKLRQVIGRAGRKRVEEQFTYGTFENRMNDILNRIIRR